MQRESEIELVAKFADTTTWSSLARVSPEEWNAAVPGVGLPWSYGYVATRGGSARHGEDVLLIRDQAGLLCAALPTRLENAPLSSIYDAFANVLEPALGITTEQYAPWLSLGPPSIYVDKLLPGQEGLGNLIWAAVLQRARRLGATAAIAMHLDPAGAADLRRRGATTLLVGLTAEIDTAGLESFDAYLRTLPRKRRGEVHREIGRFAGTGLKVRLLDRADVDFGKLADLYARNLGRHGDPDAVRSARAFMDRHATALGSHVRVWACTQGAHLVGFSLACEFNGRLWVRAVGFDYDRAPRQAEYFTLCYYEPLHYALERRLERVDLGIGVLDAKRWRGAKLTPRWCAVSFLADEPDELARRADAWNSAQSADYVRRYGHAVRQDSTDG